MVIQLFVFTGERLELNMATAASGSIRVEVQDAEGKPFKDFGLDDAYELFGNETAKLVK